MADDGRMFNSDLQVEATADVAHPPLSRMSQDEVEFLRGAGVLVAGRPNLEQEN